MGVRLQSQNHPPESLFKERNSWIQVRSCAHSQARPGQAMPCPGTSGTIASLLLRAAAKSDWDLFSISKSLSLTKFNVDKIRHFSRTGYKMTKSRCREYCTCAAEAILGSLSDPDFFFGPGLFVPGPQTYYPRCQKSINIGPGALILGCHLRPLLAPGPGQLKILKS